MPPEPSAPVGKIGEISEPTGARRQPEAATNLDTCARCGASYQPGRKRAVGEFCSKDCHDLTIVQARLAGFQPSLLTYANTYSAANGPEEHRHKVAEKAAATEGQPSWYALHWLIFHLGKFRCRACGCVEETMELGHLVDRVAGGLDTPWNLVPMCIRCNRYKPLHHTQSEALAWCDAGGYWFEILAYAERKGLRRPDWGSDDY